MKKCHYITVSLLLFTLLSCQDNNNKQNFSADPVKVKVMQVSSGTTNESRYYSGTVEESNATALSFPSWAPSRKYTST